MQAVERFVADPSDENRARVAEASFLAEDQVRLVIHPETVNRYAY